jgi:hypothetical protein
MVPVLKILESIKAFILQYISLYNMEKFILQDECFSATTNFWDSVCWDNSSLNKLAQIARTCRLKTSVMRFSAPGFFHQSILHTNYHPKIFDLVSISLRYLQISVDAVLYQIAQIRPENFNLNFMLSCIARSRR